MVTRYVHGGVIWKAGLFLGIAVMAPARASDVGALCKAGEESLKQGHFDAAIARFTEALEQDPRCLQAYFGRARAYAEKGDFEKAICDYSEVLRLNPRHGEARVRRGGAYIAKGEADKAVVDLTEAIRDRPTASAYGNRAVAYMALNRLDSALADCNEAIRLDPGDALYYVNRA